MSHVLVCCSFTIYLFIYLLFSHNKDYTSITLYKDVARGPQKTTRLVRGGPLVTIILSNRTITIQLDKDRVPLGGKFQRKKQGKTAPPKK